ncbi:TIGR02677 family protein [Nocardiopsis tropica]|uniref:TIGR02677 family protein n=1 Tax=Nocardiopsis tropica TaxID=109330 RepID=A0ABU7KIX1_9ACTN|nr:TIGR02677 family protein [Nocardiopsis umidischolae]MEE2048944.1 TIGR02677 family protein [Nocardiopsis umidischolae]
MSSTFPPPPGGLPEPDAPSDHSAFAHLNAPNADLYRAVMAVFVRAKEQFRVHLRPEEVHTGLPETLRPPTADPVADALAKLALWGNLRQDPDTERVTAVEDFYRRRHIYQLTRAGEAVERALHTYDEALGQRGALQTVALDDIATQLRALLELAGQEDPDPAVTHLTLRGLVDRFTDLADNASAFMGSLQRTIDLHDADVDAFLAYKDRLISYLERFIADLITRGAEIAGVLTALDDDGTAPSPAERLLRVAALREAADAAPGQWDDDLPADDPPQFREALEAWLSRWEGLRSWFVSAPDRPAQSQRLRVSARSAIPQLLRVVAVINERRTGRSDRSADFRALARWFAEAPDDDARHRLWRTAFGLHPSRHLTVDPATADAREQDQVPAATPWSEAEPLTISPRLRRTGSYERRGRSRKVVDRSEERRYLAELARKQAREIAAARAGLATDGTVRLSALGELDPVAFGLFLQLLGDALARWGPGTTETVATSNDGTMEIHLSAIADGGTATVRTPGGTFSGPDHLVRITDVTGGGTTW